MFTNVENVHTVERITKAVCRAGRCSQTSKMFTQWSGSLKLYAGLAGRCSQASKMFTQWSGSLKRYAGLEDVHKRRKCSHSGADH